MSVREYTPIGRRNVGRPRIRWYQHHHGRQNKSGKSYTLLLMIADDCSMWNLHVLKFSWRQYSMKCYLFRPFDVSGTDSAPSTGCYLYRPSDVSGTGSAPSTGCYLYTPSDVSGTDPAPSTGCYLHRPSDVSGTDSAPFSRMLLVQTFRRFRD